MRRGTISWGLSSGTAVAAKARKRVNSPLHTYSVQAQRSAVLRLPEIRSLTGVLLVSKEASRG